MVRSPLAVISSWKRLGWDFDFANLLDQPALMRDWLAPFEPEMRASLSSSWQLVDRVALLWRVIYSVVADERFPKAYLLRHEDLSQRPVRRLPQALRRPRTDVHAKGCRRCPSVEQQREPQRDYRRDSRTRPISTAGPISGTGDAGSTRTRSIGSVVSRKRQPRATTPTSAGRERDPAPDRRRQAPHLAPSRSPPRPQCVRAPGAAPEVRRNPRAGPLQRLHVPQQLARGGRLVRRAGPQRPRTHRRDAALPAGKTFDDVERWLDFGCGYGRVLRFLVERVPAGRISATDVIEEGVEFCRSEFGVTALRSRTRSRLDAARRRSTSSTRSRVITHLNEQNSRAFLQLVGDSLTDRRHRRCSRPTGAGRSNTSAI